MSRPTVSPVLLAILALILAACGGPTAAPEPSAPTETAVSVTLAEPIEAPSAAVSTGLPTLESLDRDFIDSDETARQRDALVEGRVAPRVADPRVVEALRAVPRHSFIPTYLLNDAYNDHPLPIGYGQTISQPSLVAMMTELLGLQPGDRVLEIGTGSGYQAAILRELTGEVYTVEIIPELAATARAVLDRLGYADIHIDRRDGYYGWEEYAPYDAIIVTAAPDHLPQPLAAQLTDGGRMVIPIGPVGNVQTLWLVTREGDEVSMERLLDVMFVPFTRESE